MSTSEPYRSSTSAYRTPNRDANLLIAISLATLFGTLLMLLNLVSENWALTGVFAAVAVASFVASGKLHKAETARLSGWLHETYGVQFTVGEIQRLQQGKAVNRAGSTWLKVDEREEPWVTGLALRRLQVAKGEDSP